MMCTVAEKDIAAAARAAMGRLSGCLLDILIKHLQEPRLKHYVLLCRGHPKGHELPTLVMIAINIATYHNL